MELSQQVISLEYAKQLKELNIKQESLFYWSVDKELKNELIVWNLKHKNCANQGNLYDNSLEYPQYYDLYSAFTVAELLDLLPRLVTIKEDTPFNTFRLRLEKSFFIKNPEDVDNFSIIPHYIVNYRCDATEVAGEAAWLERTLTNNICDENCANALAKLLIFGIENNYIEVKNALI